MLITCLFQIYLGIIFKNRKIDNNGDGFITFKELTQFLNNFNYNLS